MLAIVRALDQHEHHVTFALYDEYISIIQLKLPNVDVVRLGPIPKVNASFDLFHGESSLHFTSRVGYRRTVSLYRQMHDALFDHLLKTKYGLMVIDMFAFAAQDIAHDLNIPFAIISTTTTTGILDLPSWIPRGYDALTLTELRNSAWNRFYNSVIFLMKIIYYSLPHVIELDRLRSASNRTRHTLLPSSPMQRWKGHPILIPYPLALEFRRAFTPNYCFLGFILSDQSENIVSILFRNHTFDEKSLIACTSI
jgi:hypothetical protein